MERSDKTRQAVVPSSGMGVLTLQQARDDFGPSVSYADLKMINDIREKYSYGDDAQYKKEVEKALGKRKAQIELVTESLDKIATEFEQAGRSDMALAVDMVSDRLDGRKIPL